MGITANMKRIAIVDGIRTPFVKSWTLFEDIPAQRLGALAVRELIERANIDINKVDEVIFGSVAQPVEATNVARVISLYAGIPKEKRAHTVSRNCASGFESVTSAYEKIMTGLDKIVVAGGAESMSNIPFLIGKDLSKIIVKLNKAKNFIEKFKLLSQIKPSYLKPVPGLLLGLTDPVCGLNMGGTAEIIVKEYGVSRKEQDEFALLSHIRAVEAREKFKEEIVPVTVPPDFDILAEHDNGPRENQTMEALANLKPFFDKYTGTVTAGNSSQITDGAAAILVMEEEEAKAYGYEPLGYIRSYTYVGVEPSKMGIGPAYAIPYALKKAGLKLKDMDVIEINEAFAGQVLVCLKLLASKKFAEENFSESEAIGEIKMDKLNVNGGAIALGHPVGTTGSRLILTSLKELKRRNGKFALVSLCVGGGQGGAVILER